MTIRLIHVGLGGFGQDWERRRFPQVPEVERVACVDPEPAMLARAQERLKVPAEDCFGSLAEAMEAREADAVLITTPVDGHAPLAIEAMRAGKHVITEKPFAASLDDAREAIEVADETQRILLVSQNYRYQPAARTAAQLIADQALGQLGGVRVDFRKWANDKEPGTNKHYRLHHPLLFDMAIHHFDLMRFILGREAKSVFTQVTDPPWSRFVEEASATVTVTFEDDLVVSYRGSWVSPGEPTTWSGDWHLECEQGEIFWTGRSGDDDAPHEVVRLRQRGEEATEDAELIKLDRLGRAGSLTALVEAIETGEEPETSGRRNLGTLALMEAAARSAVSGQVEQV